MVATPAPTATETAVVVTGIAANINPVMAPIAMYMFRMLVSPDA